MIFSVLLRLFDSRNLDSPPGSTKAVDFCTNRIIIYEFVLVINNNVVCIFTISASLQAENVVFSRPY